MRVRARVLGYFACAYCPTLSRLGLAVPVRCHYMRVHMHMYTSRVYNYIVRGTSTCTVDLRVYRVPAHLHLPRLPVHTYLLLGIVPCVVLHPGQTRQTKCLTAHCVALAPNHVA